MQTSTLGAVMDGLMRRYSERVPDVRKVINAMIDAGVIASPDEIENDHIAFRDHGCSKSWASVIRENFHALRV